MRGEQAFRVGDRRLRDARRKNAGGRLLVFLGHCRDACDGASAVGRRRVGGVLKIARGLRVFLRAGHRQEIGIARLAARKRLRGFDHAPQRIVVRLVGGGAGRAAIEHGPHRYGEHLLRDVLMDRVVGEARERVGDHADLDFGFVRVAQFENSLGNAPHVRVGKQMQGRHGGARCAPFGSARFLRRIVRGSCHKSPGCAPPLVAQTSVCGVPNDLACRLQPGLIIGTPQTEVCATGSRS